MAIAATFMIKFVKISTKVATLNTKTNQWAFWNMMSHSTAIHWAAPVCHRQKPILMAPLKRRMIFHGYIFKFFNRQYPEEKEQES